MESLLIWLDILNFVSKSPIKNNEDFGTYSGLQMNRRQANIWNNDGLMYWRMSASPHLDQ